MGFLNNQIVTVDAILTKKGRELLARGDGSFNITQFALSDDEIDYTLYNPNHPSGSQFYGEAIVNMPMLEAFPDENQVMKYKLVSLPRGTAKMPIIDVGYTSISLRQGASLNITPQTLNYLGNNSTTEDSGYTATISDTRLFSIFRGVGLSTQQNDPLTRTNVARTTTNTNPAPTTTVGTNISQTVLGTTINIKATTVNTLFNNNPKLQATLTITGRDSGARVLIPVTVTQNTSPEATGASSTFTS